MKKTTALVITLLINLALLAGCERCESGDASFVSGSSASEQRNADTLDIMVESECVITVSDYCFIFAYMTALTVLRWSILFSRK